MALRYVRQQLSPRPFLLFPERCCADEEWTPHPPPKVRILSFTVQLSDPAEYEGGELQIGLQNMTRTRGSAVVFPSYQLHRVSPVTEGRRASLVGWVMGEPTTKYWTHAMQSCERLLGQKELPDDLRYQALLIVGNYRYQQGRWAEAMEISLLQIALGEHLHNSSAQLVSQGSSFFAEPPSFHAENLGKAHLRYSLSLNQVDGAARTEEMVATARAACDVAARLTTGDERGLSLENRARWEAAMGDTLKAWITMHQVYSMVYVS